MVYAYAPANSCGEYGRTVPLYAGRAFRPWPTVRTRGKWGSVYQVGPVHPFLYAAPMLMPSSVSKWTSTVIAGRSSSKPEGEYVLTR